MSIATVRTAIVATLAAVPNVGVVQPYERYAADMRRLAELYQDPISGSLRGWFVKRAATAETSRHLGRGVERARWQVRGFMALSDADESELVFDGLLEAVRDAFRADETLGGAVASTVMPNGGESGIQVEDVGPVMFGGVLCHSARLVLNTMRYLTTIP